MSRYKHLAALAIVASVSVVFGMLLASGPLRRSDTPQPAVWSPAMAAPPEISAGPAAISFADVAERADAAVVSVSNVEIKKISRDNRNFDLPFEDPFRFFFGPPQRNPERRGKGDEDDEQRLESGGSGFIISEDGYILTNNHVVEKASKLQVTMENGEKYSAKVVGKDEMIDLALIKVETPRRLPVLPLGDSDSLRVGEWVIAIGNPLGYDHTVTVGVVSGKGRQLVDLGDLDRSLANFIQTDAAINFGNSGGPLLNSRGQVVGINTAITRNYGPYQGLIQGIGFALPINQVKSVLDQLKDTGKVSRGYLGISISPIHEKDQKAFGLSSTSGALVQDVTPGLPADAAGIKPGDVIVSVNGGPVKDSSELIRNVSSRRPGESVSLDVIRDGREMSFKIRLGDRGKELARRTQENEEENQGESGDEEEPTSISRLGVKVAELTGDLARRNSLPDRHPSGVLVLSVRASSDAYEEGLRQGMIITKVNSTPVRTLEEFRGAVSKLRPGDYVRLYVVSYSQEGDQIGRFVVFQVEK